MVEAIVAILVGLMLASEALGSGSEKLVGPLRPFKTVIGVVALVVGVLNITSVTGIALIVGGLVLATSALGSVPKIGADLQSAGQWLSRFRVVLGIIILLIGIMSLLSPPPWARRGGPPPDIRRGPPQGVPPS